MGTAKKINKRTLIFEIIISVLMFLSLITIFMPYIGITNKDVNKAFNKNFGKIYGDHEIRLEIVSQEDADKEVYLMKKRSGIKIVGDLLSTKVDEDLTKISSMKKVTVTFLILSWVFAAATIILILVLGGKLKYILSMVSSLLASFFLIANMLILPNIFKNALIEAIENKLVDDGGVWNSLLGDFVKATLLDRAGDFVRDLLKSSIRFGFWLFFTFAISAFIASLVGLILECVKGKSAGKIIAKIMGLSGEYEGAEMEIGQGIIIGRSPSECQLIINSAKVSRKHCKIEYNENTGKYIVTDYSSNGTYVLGGRRLDENVSMELEKGAIIQLGKKGDTFRLS